MDEDEIIDIAIKLYTYKNKSWHITGYKCPFCLHHYHTKNKRMLEHIYNCEGTFMKNDSED